MFDRSMFFCLNAPMSKKMLIFGIPIFLLAVLGGVLWVVKEKSEKIALDKAKYEEKVAKKAAIDDDFAKYNKTLARHRVTGVTDLDGPYKKVTVSNGSVTFSFEVPDRWLTETRNSGEVEMNEEELREFLGTNYDGDIRGGYSCKEVPTIDCRGSDDCSNGIPGTQRLCGEPTGDYWDFTWGMLKDMLYSEMKSYYDKKRDEFSPGFPNATVSSGMKNAIWYTDTGWDQIHFYILDEKKDASYLAGVGYFNRVADIQEKYKNFEKRFQKEVRRDKNDKPIIDKGDTWGFGAYLKRGDSIIRVWKEAYVEGEFEDGFKHLIETFKFE